jgi:hypothetical protein
VSEQFILYKKRRLISQVPTANQNPVVRQMVISVCRISEFTVRPTALSTAISEACRLRKWGWTNPALIDEKGNLHAGHGRLAAAPRAGVYAAALALSR